MVSHFLYTIKLGTNLRTENYWSFARFYLKRFGEMVRQPRKEKNYLFYTYAIFLFRKEKKNYTYALFLIKGAILTQAHLCASLYFSIWSSVTNSIPEAFTFGSHFTTWKADLSSVVSAVKIFNILVFLACRSVLNVSYYG